MGGGGLNIQHEIKCKFSVIKCTLASRLTSFLCYSINFDFTLCSSSQPENLTRSYNVRSSQHPYEDPDLKQEANKSQ